MRSQSRDSRLHRAGMEGRAVARALACGRRAGERCPAERPAPYQLQIGGCTLATRPEKSWPDDARGVAEGEHRRRSARLGTQATAWAFRAAQDSDDDF